MTDPEALAAHLAPLRKTESVVYGKPPIGGPEAVLPHLSRYTYRVAISNHRPVSADAETVSFRWKDYRIKTGNRSRGMRLETLEFIRRFLRAAEDLDDAHRAAKAGARLTQVPPNSLVVRP